MTSAPGFAALAIHAGQDADPVTGAVVPPIYQASTYKQDRIGELRGGYEYSRAGNPTRTAPEQCLAAIEHGHDLIGGALITRDRGPGERLHFHQFAAGAIPGPFDAWLTLRGIRTLEVRMARHCGNAEAIAGFLREHPAVDQVFYPGHDGAGLHQMRRGRGMTSFLAAGGEPAARAVCENTTLFTLGETLGGAESLSELPSQMTHPGLRGTELEVPPNLVRLSIGIESVSDLLTDLDKALSSAS